MKKANIFIILSLFMTLAIYAKEPIVTLELDSRKMDLNQNYTINVVVKDEVKLDSVDIIGSENFKVIGTSQMSSSRSVNFKKTVTFTKSFKIMAVKEGTFKIKGRAIKGKKSYFSNEEIITVRESNANKSLDSEILLQGKLADNEIYVGQSTVLDYYVYTLHKIYGLSLQKELNFDSRLIVEELDTVESKNEIISGDQFTVMNVMKRLVTPIESGEFVIDDLALIAKTRHINKQIQADALTLKVKPLPPGRPVDFSGLVGELTIRQNFPIKKEIEYGDSVTMKVELKGTADLNKITKIINGSTPGFKVYEKLLGTESEIVDGKYISRSVYELIIVPGKSGEVTFSDMKISYFDTISETYKEAIIKGFNLKVSGDIIENSADSIINLPKEKIVISSVEIKEANKSENFYTINISKKAIKISTEILFLIFLLIIIVLFFKKYNSKKTVDIKKEIDKATNYNQLYELLSSEIKIRYNFSIKAHSLDGLNVSDSLRECLKEIENGILFSKTITPELKIKLKNIF